MSEHELWNELGNLYFISGSYGQAVHAYRRSIQLDDSFGRPYSNLALTYVQQGKFEEAVDLYRRSIELLLENNEKAISWNRLGNVYRYLKDYQSALMAYQRADELDPESGESDDRPGWVSETSVKAQPDREVDIIFPSEPKAEPVQEEVTAVFATQGEPEAAATDQSAIVPEDVVASWALTDLNPYQQDVSASPGSGPLTSWGTPNPGQEGEPIGPPDEDTDFEEPDASGDDLSIWLPLPEQAPQDALVDAAAEEETQVVDEVLVPEALEGDKVPIPEPPPEEPPAKADEAPTEPEAPPTPAPVPVSVPQIIPSIVIRREITDSVEPAEQPAETQVAVEVEERPTPEFVYALSQTAETVTDVETAEDDLPTAEVSAAAPDQASAGPERSDDEIRKMRSDIAKYRRVVQINPRNAHAWDTLGNLYKSAGQYSESLTAYQQAVATDPGRALYHHHLGLLYACLGRTEDAICSFQRVIEIDPNHSLAHATLGGYYRKMGLEELAQKHIGKAMKSIFDSENEYNRACLAAICGNADEALELLQVALRNKQTYVDWILRDPDLDFIRQDPRFRQLISDYTR